MKTYTFVSGKLSEGIAVQSDERFGQVVYLGEAGRGRRYEKVSLDRHNPAEVKSGRVFDVYPKKITLPARDGKPEKSFYVLAKPRNSSDSVLVRVNTQAVYTKNTRGYWKTIEGKPDTLTSGYGAHGLAGRIGNWNDGLVSMKPGDVLMVKPEGGHKTSTYALWVDDSCTAQVSTWDEYENLSAIAQAEEQLEKAQSEGLPIRYGTMPAYTWKNGKVSEGISVDTSSIGMVVRLGESGRGRNLVEVPVINLEGTSSEDDHQKRMRDAGFASGPIPLVVEQAAVAVLDDSKDIVGLTSSEEREQGAFLVHISTQAGYTRNSNGYIEAWKGGDLRLVAQGRGAHGAAGYVCNWTDNLVVMREGDVIFAKPEFGRVTVPWAVFVKNGKLHTEKWSDWKYEDALHDPNFYIAKGTAPWGYVPAEWVGRVVTVTPKDTQYGYEETGELISINPFVLNMGWDGRDRTDRTFNSGRWVKLEANKEVTRLEGEAADQRTEVKDRAAAVLTLLEETRALSYFRYARMDFSRLFEETRYFDTMETEGYSGIEGWVERAEAALAKFEEKRSEAIDLESRVNAGAILFDFEVWNRRGGMTNNGAGWVITPDGERRPHDTDDIARHKSDGNLTWHLVLEDELALRWTCGHMRNVANSTFEVAKMPVSGLTDAQMAVVVAIEEDLGVPNGFGLDKEAKAEADAHEEKILTAVCEAMVKAPWFKSAPADLELAMVASQDGQYVTDDAQANLDRVHDTRGAKQIRVASRVGKLVGIDKNVAGGWLLFMTYHKYGHMNMNVRWLNSLEAEALAAVLEWGVFETLPAITQEALEGEHGVTSQYAFSFDEYEEKDLLEKMYDGATGAEDTFDGDPAKVIHYAQIASGVIELVVYLSYGSHPRWLVRYVK